ncbi:MAG: 2-hydroxyacyl-CoA dehydratase [Deltaproteobacteria bacterium]|nr:2-hydroxyacyl-CoA dehydratase [Deltaproteobacteria bacterium]
MNEKNKDIFSRIESYYTDYGQRAKELKNEGIKIIGYMCSLIPLEIITAAGCVPFRMRGDVREPITKGDINLETIACPFYRSRFDLSVKGKYDFLDGSIVAHGCDSMARTYAVWKYTLDLPYSHFVNLPHTISESSREFFRAGLNTFRKSLGKFAGKEISDDDLAEAIGLYNENRDKVRALYELRKPDPPIVSGTEITKILTVGASLPVAEANKLFDEVLEELRQRKESPFKKVRRIMIDGACMDNIELVKLIEDLGGNVVVDTLCNGTRDNLPHTDTGNDPLSALADRYLDKINCPRTYRENKEQDLQKELESRFGDIGFFAREFKADAAILYVYKYCDPFGFEVPARKAYFESIKLPLLYLEDEYSAGTIGQLKTRIQAFLEMIQ